MQLIDYKKFFIQTLAAAILVDSSNPNAGIKTDADPELIALMEAYNKGKIDIINHVIQSNKSISSATDVDFFLTDDQKAKGLRNLANAKLDNGAFFVPAIVQVLAGDLGATPSDTLLRAEPYDDIFNAGGNLNSGEFTLKVNTTAHILKETAMSTFVTTSSSLMKGSHFLGSASKVAKPGYEILASIKLGTAAAANLGVALRLHGAIAVPRS